MPRPADSTVSDTNERPSVIALVAVVAVALVALVLAVKLVGWLIGLAVPIAVVAIGASLVASGRRAGGSALALIGGWAAVILGGLWLLDRLW